MDTPSRLRALAQAATPGPWKFNDSTDPRGHKGEFRAPSPHNGFMPVGPWINDADAPLMALSPDLAVWAADAADELQRAGYWDVTTDKWRCPECESEDEHEDGCPIGALLARLDVLVPCGTSGKETA